MNNAEKEKEGFAKNRVQDLQEVWPQDSQAILQDAQMQGIKQYDYVRIEKTGLSSSGKTELWAVISKRGGHFLGSLKWYARWRQYAFYPSGNTVFSAGCLRDIASFIDAMMKARKK